MKFLFPLLILILLNSCKKEALLDEAPSLVGDWIHYTQEDAWHIIHIKTDGNGVEQWSQTFGGTNDEFAISGKQKET